MLEYKLNDKIKTVEKVLNGIENKLFFLKLLNNTTMNNIVNYVFMIFIAVFVWIKREEALEDSAIFVSKLFFYALMIQLVIMNVVSIGIIEIDIRKTYDEKGNKIK